MNVALWVAQGLLAAAFVMAVIARFAQPREQLAQTQPWVEHFSDAQIRAISILEFAAAVGLVLPAVAHVATVLVPLAAVGIILLMIGALVVNVRGSQTRGIVTNLIFIALAAFIAWGRFGPYHF